MNTKKKWLIPLGMWLVFEIVAVTLWLTKDNLFYLLNFSYIGSAIALGLLLFQLNYRHARRIGFIRYITFTASFVFVGALFLCHVENIEQIMFWAFLVGNILYYAIGIILAFAFRDNRAFCKYISTWHKNSAPTKTSDAVKVIYRIKPIFFLGAFGVLYGMKSKTIAVQQAYPHQPLPNNSGPKIFATA